jgi:hypothetical protein
MVRFCPASVVTFATKRFRVACPDVTGTLPKFRDVTLVAILGCAASARFGAASENIRPERIVIARLT